MPLDASIDSFHLQRQPVQGRSALGVKLIALLLITGIIAGLLTVEACAQSIVVYPTRPEPKFESSSFCPPGGNESKGADADLNKKKNRIDPAPEYYPYRSIGLIKMQTLEYPEEIGKRKRDEWTAEQRRIVAEYEGI